MNTVNSTSANLPVQPFAWPFGPNAALTAAGEVPAAVQSASAMTAQEFATSLKLAVDRLVNAPTSSESSAAEPKLLSPDAFAGLMWQVFAELDKVGATTVGHITEQLRNNGQRQQKLNVEQNTKLEEAAKKAAKAKSPWGLIGAIFAAIGSIFLAVVTAGAATPVTALAICGAIAAGVSVIDQGSKLAGGQGFNPIKLITEALSGLVQLFGVSKKNADKFAVYAAGVLAIGVAVVEPASLMVTAEAIGNAAEQLGKDLGMSDDSAKWLGFGVTIGVTMLTIACVAYASAGTVLKAAQAGKSAALTAEAAAAAKSQVQTLKRVATVATAAGEAIQGGAAIASAVNNYERAQLIADTKRLEAVFTMLKLTADQLKQRLIDALDGQQTNVEAMATVLQSRAAVGRQLAA